MASLSFGGVTGNRIEFAVGTNQTAYTVMGWYTVTTHTNGARFWSKGGKDSFCGFGGTGSISHAVARATQDGERATGSGAFALNTPTFFAWTYDEADGPRIFIGTLSATPAEPAYTLVNNAGSGATTADGSTPFKAGTDQTNGAGGFAGRCHWIARYRRRMTLAEIRRFWSRSVADADCDLFAWPGRNGTSTVYNLCSLNQGAGTTVGSVSIGAGLPRPRRMAASEPAHTYKQIAQPVNDIAAGAWTTETGGNSGLATKTADGVIADDTTLIRSEQNPNASVVTLGFPTTVVDPVSSVEHTVRYRFQRSSGDGQVDMLTGLLQGSTTIASWAHVNLPAGVTEAVQTLSAAEADAITDYSLLRFTAGASAAPSAPTVPGARTTAQANGGNLTINWWSAPNAPQLNDIALMTFVSKDNVVATMPGDWTQIIGLNAGTTTRVSVWWKRCAGTETGSVTITRAAGNSGYAVLEKIVGCVTTGSPIDAVATNDPGVNSTTITAPSVTPTQANDRLTLIAFKADDPNMTTQFGGTDPVPQILADGGTTLGTDCGIYHASGVRAAVSATGARTATHATSGRHVGASILFKGVTPTVRAQVTWVQLRIPRKLDVGGTVFADRIALWRVQEAVQRDRIALWRVRESIQRDRVALWRSLEAVLRDRVALWTVINAVQRDRVALWRVLNGVLQDRVAAWRILESVAPADRMALWTVINLVSRDRTALWQVRNAVQTDRTALWTVREAVQRDRIARWNILAPVQADRVALWRVVGYVQADRVALWNVRTMVERDRVALWRILETTSRDRIAIWRVLEAVQRDRVALWIVRNAVARDRVALWHVRGPVQADRVALWRILEAVLRDRVAVWHVRNAVQADRTALWRVHNIVSRDRMALWIVREAAQRDRIALWDILGTAVSADRTALWHVGAATVLADRVALWRVREAAPPADRIALWHVRESIQRDRVALWTVRQSAERDRAALWRVLETTSADHTALWRILEPVSRDRVALWRVRESIQRDRVALWRVLETVAASDHTALWHVHNAVLADHRAVWHVLETLIWDQAALWRVLESVAPADRTALWQIINLVQRDHTARWAITGAASHGRGLGDISARRPLGRWRTGPPPT